MAHPLYHQSLAYLKKPVTVHLKSGRSHYGVMQRVTQDGIYLIPLAAPRYVSAKN